MVGRGRIMPNLILDTMIIRYASGPRSAKRKKAREILDAIKNGRYGGIIPPPVIMEIYYQMSDVYDKETAKTILNKLISIPNMTLFPLTIEMGYSAGIYYYKYNTISTNDKKPSAVDCLIAGMGHHIPDSIVCTNDNKILDIVEINAKRPWGIRT